jgi:hypothetical protein
MSKENDGGPAYPQDLQGRRGDDPQYQGMSLRDWFAGQALAGIMASGAFAKLGGDCDLDNPQPYLRTKRGPEVAAMAMIAADAMLEARAQ